MSQYGVYLVDTQYFIRGEYYLCLRLFLTNRSTLD